MNCKNTKKIEEIRKRLYNFYGPLNWWPADNTFEVCVGAILTQNTSWKNVEKAIQNLKKAKILDCRTIAEEREKFIANLIKPSGYFNQKAKKLKAFCVFLKENYGCSLNEFFNSGNVEDLRKKLLSIWGIGKETADSILLYAGNKPVFVVDAYTKRVFSRHGICNEDVEYDQLRNCVENTIYKNVSFYNEFHAGLVSIGKDYCKKTSPVCNLCPLKDV